MAKKNVFPGAGDREMNTFFCEKNENKEFYLTFFLHASRTE